MKPTAYEGNEPYIFISYAHKDAESVYEVLGELEQRGYRFWYDDGIAPGSEWPEDIARHLDASAMVMAFVTQNAMDSQNCRREINFSLSKNKPFLSVLMEPTNMPLGMEMQLSAQQSIVRYNYDSWEGFIKKILSCPSIAPCLAQPEPEPEPAAAAAAAPEPASAAASAQTAQPTEVAKPSAQTGQATQPPQPAETSAAPAAESLPTNTPNGPVQRPAGKAEAPASASAKAPKKRGAIIGAIVAAFAIVAVAIFALGGGLPEPSFETSWGSEVKLDSTNVSASDKTITQEDLESIAALKSLHTLSFQDCDLSGCDLSSVTFASEDFYNLSLAGSTGVDDFSFLSRLSLQRLDLSGCEAFNDLSALAMDELRQLKLDGTGVSSLEPLSNCQLDTLSFSNTAVSDLSSLATQARLNTINGAHSGVTSIQPIASLEKLTSIDFSGCALAQPKGALKSLSLTTARLADTGLDSLSMLQNCTILEELDISGNGGISSLSDLSEKNYATFKSLDVSRTGLDADALKPIAQCTALTRLSLDGVAAGNLDFCKDLAALEYLSAVNCGIKDIDGLSGSPKLEETYLSCNQISDVSALAGLAAADLYNVVLDLSFNKIDSVAVLPEGDYCALMLYGNGDGIAMTLPDDLGADEVVVSWCKGAETGGLASRDTVREIYMLDCPEVEELAMEDAVEGNLHFISEDELWTLYEKDAFTYHIDHDFSYFLSIAR